MITRRHLELYLGRDCGIEVKSGGPGLTPGRLESCDDEALVLIDCHGDVNLIALDDVSRLVIGPDMDEMVQREREGGNDDGVPDHIAARLRRMFGEYDDDDEEEHREPALSVAEIEAEMREDEAAAEGTRP